MLGVTWLQVLSNCVPLLLYICISNLGLELYSVQHSFPSVHQITPHISVTLVTASTEQNDFMCGQQYLFILRTWIGHAAYGYFWHVSNDLGRFLYSIFIFICLTRCEILLAGFKYLCAQVFWPAFQTACLSCMQLNSETFNIKYWTNIVFLK